MIKNAVDKKIRGTLTCSLPCKSSKYCMSPSLIKKFPEPGMWTVTSANADLRRDPEEFTHDYLLVSMQILFEAK